MNMKLFKPFSMNWWEIGILKIAVGALGIAIGAYWHNFFGRHITALLVIAVIAGAYVTYIRSRR